VKTWHKIVLAFAILALVNLLLVMVFGDDGLVDVHLLDKRKIGLEQKNEALNQENLSLYREIERLKHDPEYIENVARKELGVIGPDEIILKMSPRKKAAKK
jgi:cell division protein FtsB